MRRKTWAILSAVAAGAGALLALWYVVRPARNSPAPPPPAAPGAAMGGLLATGLTPARPVAGAPTPRACPIRLREVTDQCGIAFEHTDGSSGRRYVVEAMSTGLAAFDFDGDGLIDIYFPNGAPLPGAKGSGVFSRQTPDGSGDGPSREKTPDPFKPPRHALYRNLGQWRFREVTEEAGVACTAYGMGVGIGDYDNDGRPDVYLCNFGPNVLYRNHGDGTFTDVTRQAGVAGTIVGGDLAKKVGAGACFLDVEGDGRLDLYVGNYVDLDLSTHVPRNNYGIPAYPTPLDYAPPPDTLYQNHGDGRFIDVSVPSGIGAHAGRSMGMICADYDNDGDTDVFVCNDVMENFLFRNDGHGRFDELGVTAGVALNPNAAAMANMAVDCADYDRDGWLDFYTTNYQNTIPMLLRNLGKGMFEDVTATTGAGSGLLPYVNWGCGFVDFDNDGCKDIFVANGHTEDNVELRDQTTAYRCHNTLLWNTGDGRFVNASEVCGLNAVPVHAARGAAFDDLDNDGDIDVVVLNSRQRASVLRNMLVESGSKNHWLQVRLQGVKTNRDGVGAHVRVVAGDLVQIDEVHSGRGYQSHWGSRLHFGLGRHDRVDRVEVRWIGGGVDVVENPDIDRLVTITEGTAR